MQPKELIALLEKSPGPNGDLDLALAEYWPEPRPFAMTTMRTRGMKPPVYPFTSSTDRAIELLKAALPGWLYRVASCHVSDDAWVAPDFNNPVNGQALLEQFPNAGRDPVEYFDTDVDLRPPRATPALALCISIMMALDTIEELRRKS